MHIWKCIFVLNYGPVVGAREQNGTSFRMATNSTAFFQQHSVALHYVQQEWEK